MKQKADIGLIGLAVMGENLVLNMARNGYGVAVYNRTVEKVDAFTAGFEVYSAKMSRKALRVSYAKLSPRAIHFSASAVNEFGLKGYQTVDAFYKPGVLRFVFRSDNLGEFTPTKRMADRTELKICATGFVKLWKIPEAAFGKKLSIVEHGPGLLEVGLDLGSQKR